MSTASQADVIGLNWSYGGCRFHNTLVGKWLEPDTTCLPRNSQSRCDLCRMHWTGNVRMLKHLWREHKESITTSGRVSTAQPNTKSSAAFFNNFKRKLMHLGALLLSWSKKKRICFEFKVFIRSHYFSVSRYIKASECFLFCSAGIIKHQPAALQPFSRTQWR